MLSLPLVLISALAVAAVAPASQPPLESDEIACGVVAAVGAGLAGAATYASLASGEHAESAMLAAIGGAAAGGAIGGALAAAAVGRARDIPLVVVVSAVGVPMGIYAAYLAAYPLLIFVGMTGLVAVQSEAWTGQSSGLGNAVVIGGGFGLTALFALGAIGGAAGGAIGGLRAADDQRAPAHTSTHTSTRTGTGTGTGTGTTTGLAELGSAAQPGSGDSI